MSVYDFPQGIEELAGPVSFRAGARSSRDDLVDALRAVREALDIPHPATVGGGELRDRILRERVVHTVVMLRSVLEPDRSPDIPWSTAYLRARLAEHPAEGYETWHEQAAELEGAHKSGAGR